jgi:hypothetical protein
LAKKWLRFDLNDTGNIKGRFKKQEQSDNKMDLKGRTENYV